MKNLTEKQLSTLLLVQQVNEIVKTNTLNGEQLTEKFDTPVKVYNSLCENDPYDTLEIFKDIYELSKLGYIETDLEEEDLTIDNLSSLLASEDLKIRKTTVTESGLHKLAKYMHPIFCLAASNSYPAFLCIPLSTPDPMTGLGFAVFTIASTCIFTISFRTISKGIGNLLIH